MKNRIAFFAMAFILLACADAQSTDQLGPSCKSTYLKLQIPQIPQGFGTSWCWAATAQNVMAFQGKQTEQCEIVAKVYSYVTNEPCCGSTATECWGLGGYPEWAFDQFQFSYLPPKTRNANLTWTNATEEICQNRPFISSLDLVGGDRHSVVVTGYDVIQGVRIYDPSLNDLAWESFADFFEDQSLDYERFRDTYNIHPNQ
ncbi:MAG TPA: C39 family peptidase [Nitrospira sp.]|nr:C39 family peptidase [Nitrospira sp.]